MNNVWPILAFSQATLNSAVHYVTVQPVKLTAGYSDFFATYYRSKCSFSSSFHIMPNINKLMILAYGERMLRVLFVVKSEIV